MAEPSTLTLHFTLRPLPTIHDDLSMDSGCQNAASRPLTAINMVSTPQTRQSRPRFNIKIILFVFVFVVLGGYLLFQLPGYVRNRREEQEYKSLTLEYLNPDFSTEYRKYWRIANFDDYRMALRQQYDIAKFEAFEESYGENKDELLHFGRLRMINWLDRQMIDRVECLLQFKRRGNEPIGPYSIDLRPFSEAEFKEKVPY